MSSAPKNNTAFLKMSGAGNDFIIIDARGKNIEISTDQIVKYSSRDNIGCDQFIILKECEGADCFMEIYNSDGSESGACGNATRCVAAILSEDLNKNEILIKTQAGILECNKNNDEISVKIAIPKFSDVNFHYDDQKFYIIDVGNPHAVCFVDEIPIDEIFFKIGKEVESHQFFSKKTNVEFAKICENNVIEVRVFERGAGETLACGTGACAVGALAIKNKFVDENKEVLTRFKGGDLKISWDKNQKDAPVIMTGGFKKISEGFLN